MLRYLKEARPELKEESLLRTRSLMNSSVRDCLVTGYESLIEGIALPDLNHRHEVAAAIRSASQVIVTANLKDFPAAALTPFGLEAQSPDDFIFHLLNLAPGAVSAIVAKQAASLKNPPQTTDQLLETLLSCGLARPVAKLRELFNPTS